MTAFLLSTVQDGSSDASADSTAAKHKKPYKLSHVVCYWFIGLFIFHMILFKHILTNSIHLFSFASTDLKISLDNHRYYDFIIT